MGTEYLLTSKNNEASVSADLRFFGAAVIDLKKINDTAETRFNRYSISYTAGFPVRAKLHFKNSNGEAFYEEFYLEASLKETEFRSFTDEYLEGKLAFDAEKLELFNTKSSPCRVVISSFCTEIADVISDDTAYIENDYLKVGARLSWGGGLSYIKAQKGSPKGIENLLNLHDPGRLVQQAYYSTAEAPSHHSVGNGKISYNPVQGGDQYNNRSKLVDYRLDSTSMYVKCRPLDWSKNGISTKSYMENTYTLGGNLLRVDNRFIDFSAYNHTLSMHQELPAFYTISALKKFVYYNGDSPWTNDRLTFKRDMPFWGGNPEAYNHLKPNNSETWCAFTDDNDAHGDFGIGLFVPNVTMLLAGRHKFDNSADPTDVSTNYIAPIRTMKLKSFKPIEYSYLITAGTLCDIREAFAENSSLIDNSNLAEY